MKRIKPLASRDFYLDKYLKEKKSVREIAELLKTNYSKVLRDLKHYNIRLRSKEEAANAKIGKETRERLY